MFVLSMLMLTIMSMCLNGMFARPVETHPTSIETASASMNVTGHAKACCGFLCTGTCSTTYTACVKCNMAPNCIATIDYGSVYKRISVRRGRRACVYPKTGEEGTIEMCNSYGVVCRYWDFVRAEYATYS